MSTRDPVAALENSAIVGNEAKNRQRSANIFAGFRFPTFSLALILGLTVMLLAVLLIPPSKTALGEFAESFKIWCYGYDPSRGTVQWGYVAGMLIRPVILILILVGVWYAPLRTAWNHQRRAMLPTAGLGLLVAVVAAGVLVGIGLPDARGKSEADVPFPAEQLRTVLTPPKFELENQDGMPVSLSQFQGKVVLVTAVYSTCGYTCPMIMAQTKKAVEALSPEQRTDLRIVAITLDPEHDDKKTLAAMAQVQKVAAPEFNLLTGPPQQVHQALDALQVARRRDPQTGVIEHVNVHILLDRRGQIAYRLTVGERQQAWLMSALRLLLDEK